MKTEFDIQCERCGVYNLQNGRIIKGNVFCEDCFQNQEKKRRKGKQWLIASVQEEE